MSLDKEKKPFGLQMTEFIVLNIFWYLIFSLIYWDINATNWWLTQNIWGRVILVLMEFMFFNTSFRNGKI